MYSTGSGRFTAVTARMFGVGESRLYSNHNSGRFTAVTARMFGVGESRLYSNHNWNCLFVGCLTSPQHTSVSQGRICSDNFTCCHTEIEVADKTFHLTQSQYSDTGPTCPSTDPITPGAWQGSRLSANFEVTGMTRPRKNPGTSEIRTRDLPLSRRTP